jgi:DNA-binding protein HU-beta
MFVEKNEIVEAVLRRADIGEQQAGEVVDAVFESIADALKGGSEVRLVGFGTFSVAHRAASEGRNPRTGEKIKIAASKRAKFMAGKRLRDDLIAATFQSGTSLITTAPMRGGQQPEDESAVAEAFSDAATKLLTAADEILVEMRQLRKETSEIFSELEARLPSADG